MMPETGDLPPYRDVLTISDVDELPSGTATVYRVENPAGSVVYKATLDDRGYLRGLEHRKRFFSREWTVLGVER